MKWNIEDRPRSLEEAIDVIQRLQEHLHRGQPKTTPGGPEEARGESVGKVRMVKGNVTSAMGDVKPHDLIVVQGAAVAEHENIVLKSAVAEGSDVVLLLASDGNRLYEVARSEPNTLDCPVVVNPKGKDCDPILKMLSSTDPDHIYFGRSNIFFFGGLFLMTDTDLDLGVDLNITRESVGAFTVSSLTAGTVFRVSTAASSPGTITEGDNEISGRQIVQGVTQHGRTSVSLTAHQSAWNPNSLAKQIIRVTPDMAGWNINGIAVPQHQSGSAAMYTVVNVGTFAFNVTHQNGGPAAVNRIITGSGAGTITVQPDDAMMLFYDHTTQRWRVVV